MMLTGACSLVAEAEEDSSVESSPSDDVSTAAAEEAAPPPADVDCEALLAHRQIYVQMSGQMGVAEGPEPFAIFSSADFDAVEAAVEAFRPHQDVEPEVFGPLREGLDNMTADLPSARNGTFTGASGTYSSVAIIPVLEAVGC